MIMRNVARARFLALLGVLLLSGLSVGCARYEYDIARPPELARHVGAQQWVSAPQDPLDYRFITADNHLVMQIHNRTDAPIQLLGDKSVVVDPRGQSHALRSQTIAAGSFIKLILPPMPAQVQPSGPTFGFGIGLGVGSVYRGGRHGGYYDGLNDPFLYDQPRYYAVYDPNDTTFWEWTGDGEARITLTYDRGGKTVTHEFAFRRTKA
jgi:hypothetical protein